MKTRCALKILYRVRAVFPKDQSYADQLLDELKKIVDMGDGVHKDIKTLAYLYHKNLEDLKPNMANSVKL